MNEDTDELQSTKSIDRQEGGRLTRDAWRV